MHVRNQRSRIPRLTGFIAKSTTRQGGGEQSAPMADFMAANRPSASRGGLRARVCSLCIDREEIGNVPQRVPFASSRWCAPRPLRDAGRLSRRGVSPARNRSGRPSAPPPEDGSTTAPWRCAVFVVSHGPPRAPRVPASVSCGGNAILKVLGA